MDHDNYTPFEDCIEMHDVGCLVWLPVLFEEGEDDEWMERNDDASGSGDHIWMDLITHMVVGVMSSLLAI